MRRPLITTTLVSSLLLLCAATSAQAETLKPWWHLTSSSWPTYIQPGQAKDELQRVTVPMKTGSFELKDEGFEDYVLNDLKSINGGHEISPQVGEQPAKLQEELEELYGAGNVEVTSPCTGVPNPSCTEANNRYEVYEVKFVGRLSDLSVFPMRRRSPATVHVEQLAVGRPDGTIVVTATNLGDASLPTECVDVGAGHGFYFNAECTQRASEFGEGEFQPRLKQPLKMSDVLPPGLTPVTIEGVADETQHLEASLVECSKTELSCTFTGVPPSDLDQYGIELYNSTVPPSDGIQMRIGVDVTGASTGESNQASIAGGEAPAATVKAPIVVSDAAVPFGVSSYELRPEEAGGAPDTRAGSHPFQLTTSFTLNQDAEGQVAAMPKDLHFQLPPGLIGNPTPFPQCPLATFLLTAPGDPQCPADTVVGFTTGALVARDVSDDGPTKFTYEDPVYNLEPAAGEPARFAFMVDERVGLVPEVPVFLNTSVRTGGDYGVTVSVQNITQIAEFTSSETVFWGVPGDPRHGVEAGESHPPPLLALPTSCGGPLHTSMEAASWLEPHAFQPLANTEPMVALDGCDRLPFAPEIKVSPDGQQASKPTGLTVDVHVPQEGQLNSEGLAQSNVKNITVKLPAGVAIDPSGGDGLEACSANTGDRPEGQLGVLGNQIGFEGFRESPQQPGISNPAFTSYLPGTFDAIANGFAESLQPGVNFCANASKIAEATIKSPLLPADQPLKGFVYLAAQESNPFDSVIAMYIVAEDPVSGSLVKLPGKVQLCQGAGEVIAGMTCEALGQIVSTFEDEPQLAFEDAELHFFGGERAPLTSPTRCGAYTTQASFTPWSGGSSVSASSTFDITSGPNGAPCPGASLPFSPSLTGGAENVNAGAFSPFTLTMTRLPGEQNLQSVEAHLPPGLSGILSNVELCPEPQANKGECGPNSLIGETTVSVGVGGDPFTVTGGKFFITGPYNGTGGCTVGTPGCAPFGITFEVPAKAGPYDFAKTARNHPACDCVLVRGKIEINPYTAALTVTSNPPGTPDAIPTSLEGIPLEIQHINAVTTRGNFQFNPTNCSKMEVTGTVHSSEGSTDTIGVPFQVTNCAALKFTPKFTVSTSGKTSKANGADLITKVTEPSEPFGSQANIAKVKVELPLQLPSRLTTLQKACTAAQFEKNPAGCPPASFIGHAVVHTPLLPVPLEGPAIFVSHGNESFPSLTMVLQGYGVTIDLVGATFISKSGITSTTFKTVPDQPFSTFELVLPEGPYSALAANGNLCKPITTKTVKKRVTVRVKGHKKTVTRKVKETVPATLVMPNEFVAQNGAAIHEVTPISVTGCAKTVHPKKGKAKKKKRGGKRKKK